MVNSRLSQFPAASSSPNGKLLRHPFFRRYGVNLPSSLTEVRSSTWGGFPLPTCVGVRYGQKSFSIAAFLGGLGCGDFRPLARTRPSRHGMSRGFAYVTHFALEAPPVHSRGSPSLPRPRFSSANASGAGFSDLLAIAYDYDVLGLGPDSPWDDQRCPGTLRLSVVLIRTALTLLIPAFALGGAPPVLAIRLLRSPNAPLPSLSTERDPPLRSDA